MNIDELRSVQSKERQKSDLQQLRESFYGDVADYITELEAERESVAANAADPFGSPEVQQLTNDIETAKDTAEAIYERRLGKIVKKASLVSAEMANPNEVSGLTTEEQELFTDLVDRIEQNKDHMLDVIAGEVPAGSAGLEGDVASTSTTTGLETESGTPPADGRGDPAGTTEVDEAEAPPASAGDSSAAPTEGGGSAPETADADRDDPPVPDDLLEGPAPPDDDGSVSAADVMSGDAGDDDETETDGVPDAERTDGGAVADATGESGSTGPTSDADPGGEADMDRATLRVTEDVGDIFGVDEREYSLTAEDVVTLPEENAEVLVSQGAAERLD